MFNYREFLMTGFKSAVGKMADYQVIFNANGYYEKGVLSEEDLAELQSMINAKNPPTEEITEETETTTQTKDVVENE